MFAVIRTGSKQYRVQKGDILRVEKLPGEKGETIDLEDVLMTGEGKSAKIATSEKSLGVVKAEILDQIRDDKITVFKKKRRHNYRRKRGHRQPLTLLKITNIG